MAIGNEAGHLGVLRRKRASNPKTKSGCSTCRYECSCLYCSFWSLTVSPRARHLKCDERKPACQRCLKGGMKCDWKQVAMANPVVRRKVLMPKPQSSLAIVHAPSERLLKSEHEQRYFRIFCDEISRELSGLFDSGLWSRVVLQACESEPGIRYSVVAIGALGYTSKILTARPPILSSTPDLALKLCHDEAQKHHRFALKQYGIAIRLLRNSASERKTDVRTMLLGCVLTTCFETLQGNHQSAIAQIQSGLNLVADWHIANTKPHNTDDLLGTTSPSPYMIEDELMQALGRLDIQAMSFLDPRDSKIHDRMRRYGQASVDAMPVRFHNIKEARVYLELVMRRSMHFLQYISSLEGMGGCLRHTNPAKAASDRGQRKYFQELERWHSAFLHLLEYSRRPEGKHDCKCSLSLSFLVKFFLKYET